jgi:2-polyprenyl-6-hydroxyphenyl methylase/3-demethylubiquinone-9 3-methyltransferase
MRTLPRNDPRQYDDLVAEWWRPGGVFAALHWLAAARARLVPPAARDGATLVDVGCGAGLLAPHVAGKGYRLVGVDLVPSALAQAAAHGVRPVVGDATALPLPDRCADVVVAGEILEHVTDLAAAVREACRVLRPGGLLVLDTLNATALSRFVTITLAELLPRVPKGIHDPALYVDPAELTAMCARHGVRLRVRGIRPTVWGMARWLVAGRGAARIVPTWSSAVLYQGLGVRQDDGAGSPGEGAFAVEVRRRDVG